MNSINWARVAAQVVYYFRGYFAATKSNDEQVAFAVPSGNFGNICAGHIARMMGLPIARLILATNENNVLDEFFRSGRYRVRPPEEVAQTSSPSMDISNASNFERFVFDLVGRDSGLVKALWSKVDAGGEFDLAGTPYFANVKEYGFVSGSSTHADRLATIRRVYQDYGVMIDTHTADGLKVGLEQRQTGVPLDLPRNGAAGEIRRDHPRSAGTRPGLSRRLRKSGVAAAALRADGRRRRSGESLHSAQRLSGC